MAEKNLHAVDTFCREADNFVRCHPELNDTQKSFGRLAWGLLRALYECPDCPGHFRVPLNDEEGALACPNCRAVWRRRHD